jgi:hypothetical protein
VTAVRPGSFTVCPGYEAGSIVRRLDDLNAILRKEDETLRRKDVDFVRYDHGIGANITYHYMNNHRNPYARRLVDGVCFCLRY